jgi:hypothetical protein
MDLRLQDLEDRGHRGAVEETDTVDHPQVGQNLHPFGLGDDGSQLTLAEMDGEIGVDRGHQTVAESLGGFQIPQVTDVEHVEGPVDEYDNQILIPPLPTFFGEFVD